MIKPQMRIVSASGRVELRPLRLRDKRAWLELRRRNHDWLKPWEATSPTQIHFRPPRFWQLVRFHHREARALRSLSMMIWVAGEMVGQINLGGITFGALRGAHIGYWIDQEKSNRGITTEAVVTLTEYAFTDLRLHRVEISLRPENAASKRVAEKSGYTYEGVRARYLHIDGQWRDHVVFIRENPSIQ